MIPQHLSNSVEHYTPAFIVEAARKAMGGIDCDPASCTEANGVVRAITYYSLPHDGLTFDWYGRIFLNPPGGSLIMTEKIRKTMTAEQADELKEQWAAEVERWKTKSRAVAWWRKLVEEYLEGHTREAIFIGFNLDILQASQGQDEWPDVLKFPLCIPEKRIAFNGKMPTHGNVIVYLPNLCPPGGREAFPDRAGSYVFEEIFKSIGSVSI